MLSWWHRDVIAAGKLALCFACDLVAEFLSFFVSSLDVIRVTEMTEASAAAPQVVISVNWPDCVNSHY